MDHPTLTLEPLCILTKVCILLGSFPGIKATWRHIPEPPRCHGAFQDLLNTLDNSSSCEFVLLILLVTKAGRKGGKVCHPVNNQAGKTDLPSPLFDTKNKLRHTEIVVALLSLAVAQPEEN